MVELWEFQKQLKMSIIMSDSFISKDTSKVKLRMQVAFFFLFNISSALSGAYNIAPFLIYYVSTMFVKCFSLNSKIFVSLCFSYIFGKSSIT